jgi:hypothetical protein
MTDGTGRWGGTWSVRRARLYNRGEGEGGDAADDGEVGRGEGRDMSPDVWCGCFASFLFYHATMETTSRVTETGPRAYFCRGVGSTLMKEVQYLPLPRISLFPCSLVSCPLLMAPLRGGAWGASDHATRPSAGPMRPHMHISGSGSGSEVWNRLGWHLCIVRLGVLHERQPVTWGPRLDKRLCPTERRTLTPFASRSRICELVCTGALCLS